MSDLKPCPWCGRVPDISIPGTFRNTDGTKWGALHCCCVGPDVRTGYRSVEHWRDLAIEAWNTRAPSDARAAALDLAEVEGLVARFGRVMSSREEDDGDVGAREALMSAIRALIGQPQGDAGTGGAT